MALTFFFPFDGLMITFVKMSQLLCEMSWCEQNIWHRMKWESVKYFMKLDNSTMKQKQISKLQKWLKN